MDCLDVCLRYFSRWDFTIYDLSSAFSEQLLDLQTSWGKNWSGLAKSACPKILFLPVSKRGCNWANPITLIRQCQVSRHAILQNSRDPLIRSLANKTLTTQINQAAKHSKYQKFRPALEAKVLREEVGHRATQTLIRKAMSKKLQIQSDKEMLQHFQETTRKDYL
eukprot:Lithocolla_globosa_v1_NODE_1141_length_2841_cov_27.151831.p2 type:complete len:165 gc:universal NODE_1141_length_2841_cov_27.151831:1924-2418(+)